MSSFVQESKLNDKCLSIIRKNEIQDAIKKISVLKFNNKKLGRDKAKKICNLYVREFVKFKNQSDTFNYNQELNKNLAYT